MINEINHSLTAVEKGFNIAGSIPVVGLVSGSLRAIAGKVQLVTGAIFAVVGLVGTVLRPDDQKWDRIARAGVENITHGALNIIRGTGEALAGLTFIGSLFIGIIDISVRGKNAFTPYYAYGSMQELPPAYAA